MTPALLCSGQGRQAPGMFDLFEDEPAAEAVLAEAAALLGVDPRAFSEPVDTARLHANGAGQILCVTRALAAAACLAPAPAARPIVAGYSVGEMAAWGIAGIWPATDTLRLTARRAALMDEAGGDGDGLGFVRGLDRAAVERLAAEFGCAIAIVNPDRLFVVGGGRGDVGRLVAAALRAGAAHAGPIAVRVASHTPRLAAAVAPFLAELGSIAIRPVARGWTLIGAADAARIFAPAEALSGLAGQMATAIDWAATLAAVVEQGATRLLELGPGSALVDMARAAYPTMPSRALDDFRSLEGARGWLYDGGA